MCGSPRGPREQTLRPKCSILGVFWPFQPKRALPHPIIIQNMRFGRSNSCVLCVLCMSLNFSWHIWIYKKSHSCSIFKVTEGAFLKCWWFVVAFCEVHNSLLIDWCCKWANTQLQVCCVCGNVFKRRFINDEVDLVDEDNDSGQAPAVTLMEQQEIYWIAGEYTHSVDMSTIRNLFGAPRNLDLEHLLSVPDAGSFGRNAKPSSLHSLSVRS